MNEMLWATLLVINFGCILAAYRFWGRVGLFIWIPVSVIIANIQVLKTVELFGVVATLGNIVYAGSFLVTDILSENYGKRDAARGVGIGFLSMIAMVALMNLALAFTPHSSDFAHESLETLFTIMPRIAAASLIAYLISQMHDIWAYHLWKTKKPGTRYIWLRNNLSTLVSQLIDSVLFSLIAFYGVFDTRVLIEIVITTYVFKWVVAVLDTPFIYLAAHWKAGGRISET
ncbi:MAG: hypothetical protein CSA22_02170 [Deltaproteobacteria bacterium]|nr:MAG: hypothetical protein CSA22_02170 [Deltaproteobacteria bacterium]